MAKSHKKSPRKWAGLKKFLYQILVTVIAGAILHIIEKPIDWLISLILK